MSEMTPVPKDHPIMQAWERYQQTEDYANTKKWAGHRLHVDGSLWAAFEQGWRAATAATPEPPADAPPAPEPDATPDEGTAPQSIWQAGYLKGAEDCRGSLAKIDALEAEVARLKLATPDEGTAPDATPDATPDEGTQCSWCRGRRVMWRSAASGLLYRAPSGNGREVACPSCSSTAPPDEGTALDPFGDHADGHRASAELRKIIQQVRFTPQHAPGYSMSAFDAEQALLRWASKWAALRQPTPEGPP